MPCFIVFFLNIEVPVTSMRAGLPNKAMPSRYLPMGDVNEEVVLSSAWQPFTLYSMHPSLSSSSGLPKHKQVV